MLASELADTFGQACKPNLNLRFKGRSNPQGHANKQKTTLARAGGIFLRKCASAGLMLASRQHPSLASEPNSRHSLEGRSNPQGQANKQKRQYRFGTVFLLARPAGYIADAMSRNEPFARKRTSGFRWTCEPNSKSAAF